MRSYDDGGAVDNEKRHKDRSLKRRVVRSRRRKDRMKWNYLTLHIQCCIRRLRVIMVADTKLSTAITGDRQLVKFTCASFILFSDWGAAKAVNYG